jgi:hypothetical protein
MKYIILVSILFSTGCATKVHRPNYGYMIPVCQTFHDRGEFGLHAQCSQSIRNIEAKVGQEIIKNLLKK